MVSSAPQGLYSHSIIRLSSPLGWTGDEVSELGLRVVGAVASSWPDPIVGLRLGKWKYVLTTGIGYSGLSMGLFATLDIECAVRRVVPLFGFGTDGKLESWVPDGGSWDFWHKENWRRQSASLMHWTVHGHWGQWTLEPWSGVIFWGIHPGLHGSSMHFTHRAYGTCARTGNDRDKPRKKPHQIGLTHLGEDLSECNVHLLSHLGPLVLLIPGQLQLKLSPGLGNCLQLPKGCVEAECLLSLPAHISMGVEGGGRDWQWYKGRQMMAITWVLPQGLCKEWDDFYPISLLLLLQDSLGARVQE